MIYPRKNRLIFWLMQLYVQWLTGRHFREIRSGHIETDSNQSILLIANHFSFWDSLILYMVNRRTLKKNMHVMILEETMHQFWYFKYGGAFTVKKGSRNVVESLNYAAGLLADPRNMVLIFPQGRLYSNFVTQVNFEKGILRIIK